MAKSPAVVRDLKGEKFFLNIRTREDERGGAVTGRSCPETASLWQASSHCSRLAAQTVQERGGEAEQLAEEPPAVTPGVQGSSGETLRNSAGIPRQRAHHQPRNSVSFQLLPLLRRQTREADGAQEGIPEESQDASILGKIWPGPGAHA